MLASMGIWNIQQLCQTSLKFLHAYFGPVIERTVAGLWGVTWNGLEDASLRRSKLFRARFLASWSDRSENWGRP